MKSLDFSSISNQVLEDIVITGNINEIQFDKFYDNYSFSLFDLRENNINENLFLDIIPDYLLDHIDIDIFKEEIVTAKSTIDIKGKINPKITCFLNGEKIITSADGKFFKTINLEVIGKNQIFFVFILPENKLLGLRKKLIRISTPSDINDYSQNLKYYNYFFNSIYIHSINNKKLSDKFTRSDLAYFAYQLHNPFFVEYFDTYFQDINNDHWAKEFIGYAINKKFMAEYADGLFYPDKAITNLEALLTIIRVLNLPLENNYVKIPFEDIKTNHWSTKFLHAALENEIIERSNQFFPNKELTLKDFMDLVKNISDVKETLNEISNFEDGFDILEEEIFESYKIAYEEVLYNEEKRKSLRKIEFSHPEENKISFEENILFEGQIYPPTSFLINQKNITSNLIGEFKTIQPLDYGKNNFFVETDFTSKNISVFYLTSYDDLENHWFAETAAKLKYLNLIPIEPNFFPNENVTKYDFINYIYDFWGLIPIKNITLEESKIPYDDIFKDKDKFYFLISNNVNLVDETNFINPNKNISRVEAINIIAEVTKAFDLNLKKPLKKDFPFLDIPKSNPNRENIEFCYQHGLISKSYKFNPDKLISKAELIKILSNTVKTKELMKEIFNEQN